MIFSEEFLSSLKDDPINGVIQINRMANEHMTNNPDEWTERDHEVLVEVYALVVELMDAGLLPALELPEVQLAGRMDKDCIQISAFLAALERHCVSESSKLKFQSIRAHYRTSLGSGFFYEFSQGDLEKIQLLVNKVRDLIAATKNLEKDHQRRLLKRLEALQSELHKRVSDLDRFWGLIGDAGVVLGKLGTDAKPIVDRIKEIAEIVWQTQSRAEELPSGTPIPILEKKSVDGGTTV